MPKGYFTGERTHKTWTGSAIAQYHGSIRRWAELNGEKSATVHSVVSGSWFANCAYQSNRRVLSKLYYDGFGDFLVQDNLINEKFTPIPEGDIYWSEYLVF